MAVDIDRRNGERRLTVLAGGRGKGPGMAVVLRSQMVEKLMDEMIAWGDFATWLKQAAKVAEAHQAAAYKRVRSWDNPDGGNAA
jgi:hypothetical protein